MAAYVRAIQPLKTFKGIQTVVELWPDQVVIRRTDIFSKLLPEVFHRTQTVPLDQITDIVLHESREIYGRWLLFTIVLTDGKPVTLPFDRQDYHQAEDMKNALDDFISKRQPFPISRI
jgi:hypothetical protein